MLSGMPLNNTGPIGFSCYRPRTYCVTVNSVALVAVPPAVVTLILPVTAPVGTVAVT
jgi:hypothetical protein